MELKFRDLKAGEIECRVSTCNNNGVSLLLYKDARCDMNILDETVGPTNWSRSHELINGNLFCNVSIYDKDIGMWVIKQDVGTESYTEKEKGQASDAFKRACFNWGIGRELYTSPFIWISSKKGYVTLESKNGRTTTRDKFTVEDVIIDEKVIVALSIVNADMNKRVFTYDIRPKGNGKG